MKNDDSTVSSPGDGDGSSDSYRYTITAKYPPKGKKEGDIRFKTFGLEVCGNASAAFERLLSRGFYPVMNMNVIAVDGRDRDNDIIKFKNNPDGRVCLCDFDSQKDVNEALRIAAKEGAIALLAAKKPAELEVSELPVFLVTKEDMFQLSHRDQITVKFERLHGDTETMDVPSDESLQNAGSASFDQFTDAVMEEDDVPTSRESITYSTGDASDPIDLVSGARDTNASDMVEEAASVQKTSATVPSQVSLPWYTVTLKGHFGSISGAPSRTLMVVAEDASRPLVPDGSYSFMVLGFTQNEITNHDPKKQVLAYATEDVQDVSRVQSFAAEKGAVALFVTLAPQIQAEIPLFVVDRTFIQEMSDMKLGTAKFELRGPNLPASNVDHPLAAAAADASGDLGQRISELPISNIDRPLATSQQTHAAVASGDSGRRANYSGHPCSIDRKAVPSVGDSLTLSADSVEETDALPQKRRASGGKGAEKKAKKSLLGGIKEAVDGVLELFTGKEPLFVALKDRLPKSVLSSYSEMERKIDAVLASRDRTKIEKMISEAEILVKEKDCALCHIAASAYVCDRSPNGEVCRRLEELVLEAIADFNVCGSEFQILAPRRSKALVNALYSFLASRVSEFFARIGHSGCSTDGKVMRILVFLSTCGLFRRRFQLDMWRSLREYVDPEIFDRQEGSLLVSVANESFARTFALCFRRDFNDFIETALQVEFSYKDYLVNILQLLVEDQFGDRPDESDLLSAWNACLVLLARKHFGRAACEKITFEFIAKASLKSCGTYSALSEIVGSAGLKHPYHRVVRDCVKRQLSEDLKSGKLDWANVDSLLSAKHLGNLVSQELKADVLSFADEAASSSWPFEHKLLLLDALLKLFVRRKYDGSFARYERHLYRQLDRAVQTENRGCDATVALKAFLQVATTETRLFVAANSSVAFGVVAESFATANSVIAIVRSPSLLRNLAYTEDSNAELYYHVMGILCRKVLTQCGTVERASTFYGAVAEEPLASTQALHCIADEVFVSMFKKWSPTNITDIQPKHKKVLDVLFAESSRSEPVSIVTECRDCVRRLFMESIEAYSRDEVSRDILKHMLRTEKCNLWSNLEMHYSIEFPDKTAIGEKLAKLDSLEESIRRSLSVSIIDGRTIPLAEVLREYNCVDDGICDLLRDYDYLFPSSGVMKSSTKTLNEMAKEERLASDLAARGEREFYFCAYFIANPSLLFRDRVMQIDGEAHSLGTLCDSVKAALAWFETAFGSNSTYAGVDSAKTAISSLKRDLDLELSTLVSCSELKISSTDIENFLLVLLLAGMSLPIQRFVSCCKQFDFKVVHSDESFAELQRLVEVFYESEPKLLGVHDCLTFSRSLCRILFPRVGSERGRDLRGGLLAIAPILRLFSSISLYPELWNYASEMEWFGDGLKTFYEEYGNVTNVLLGDSESYEMSLLDAMEPVIRVVSAIGSLRESSDSILTLLESCLNNEDIKIGLKGGIEHHICQVHGKLSEIKDWFSNGVDEIAAAHTLFRAANLSGSYSIAEEDGKASSKVVPDPFGLYLLTLTFEVDDGESKTIRKLQGTALDHFIQQLSLIQNENSNTSAEMQGFVDQYQVLARASRNILTMFSVGYEKANISDFGSGAGSRFDSDANQILKDSEAHLRNFTSWLSSTRENFKESLLFWTEELRDLYTLIQAVGQSSMEPAILVERVARLEPLWHHGRHSSRAVLAAMQRFAASSHRRMSSAPSSWLVEVSRFLGELDLEFGRKQVSPRVSKRSSIVLHSYRCNDGDNAQIVLKILHHIYKDRSPWSFEVLDGAVPCSCDRMALFLERVKAFPAFCFVVVNANLLESKVLEKLLSFLSDREIASLGISFHCIQRGETLHTNPWMSERSWDCDALAALNSSPPSLSWQSRVFSDMSVVSSKSSGTGKTRYIRDKFRSIDKSTAQAASVVIHERTSVASLIRSLEDKFQGACQNRVLHVSFAFLPTRQKRFEKWLQDMNYFFFCLVVLHSIYDPVSTTSFSISGTWCFLFEMPVGPGGESAHEWLLANIPIVAFYSRFEEPRAQYVIDDEARRVCTYLRALSTGTINRKFEGAVKRIILVLDCSGSMQGVPFADAVRNAVGIFDSHVVEGDEFGVILFDNRVHNAVPIQTVGTDKRHLRQRVQALPFYGQGTSMYRALSHALDAISVRDPTIESWVVCLTDGVSDGSNYNRFLQQLRASPASLHVISVGVNLYADYEQNLRDLSQKYGRGDPKAFFVRSDGTTAGMDNAFQVVKSRIPVSQTFDLDGALSDDDCHRYMAQYLPSFVESDDMIAQSFWIRFLYRRVKVFDNNDSFNYNEKHDSLGSSLMEVMLSEVERLLGENLRRDWLDTNHAQLIYDFTNPKAPEFRLVCTAPDKLDPDLRQKLSGLDLPGFRIPTKSDLDQRGTLDRFLSQALDIPLQARNDGSEVLQCIDDNGFILTLDFTMKLLSIHERVACRIPCLIEGETGVSKSALTKMYSILLNSSLASKSRLRTLADLGEIEGQLEDDGFDLPATATASEERLRQAIMDNADDSDVAARTFELLQEKMSGRPAIFAPENTQKAKPGSIAEEVLEALDFFSQSVLERTFFDINVDSSLTEADFIRMFREIRTVAKKLRQCDATVVIFLDEINTSSVLGLLKEVVIDHSIAGDELEENIVVVAALNPPRSEIQTRGRERDLSYQWASGHYQVASLPGSMNKLKWSYGSLTHSQEKDFIYRRIEALHGNTMPSFLRASLTEVVSESHEIMRRFAEKNILDSFLRVQSGEAEDMDRIQAEAEERARSVVSLRDIQRVFTLFQFFFEDLKGDSQAVHWSESETQRRAMLLAVATVYYLRLDNQSREEFVSMLESLPTEKDQTPGFLEILDAAMDTVIAGSEIPSGIALTRGLRENIFVTLACSLSQTPLLIVGPPGTSKTLSVNVVDSNANGSDSLSKFYGKRPRLSLFHYQCSKQSTSKEIAAVFTQAIQRQERIDEIDETKHRCVVFMDEAGLPESERESLKVLHYLLEGHMSAKAKVGFVAISNHVLDAAKSNRCVMLLRQEPDEKEMESITTGVLFDVRDDGRSCVHDVDLDGVMVPSLNFAARLCSSYTSLFREGSGLSHLVTFFGLRDYIYFLKAVRAASRTESTRLYTSVKILVAAMERNFNGITAEELRRVSTCFLKPFASLPLLLSTESLEEIFRHPMVVLKDALTASAPSDGRGELDRPRFKLILDCTEDDSILRLLSKGDVAEVTKRSLYKFSSLPDNADLEQLRLIAGVTFAALQGQFCVLRMVLLELHFTIGRKASAIDVAEGARI